MEDEPMNLLKFPTEILQLILKFCSTSSYLKCLLTCRTLYDVGTTSREALLRQLEQIPRPGTNKINGTKTEGKDEEEEEEPANTIMPVGRLYSRFRHRAEYYSYGADINSDMTLHTLSNGAINPLASCILSCSPPLPNVAYPSPPNVALVPQGSDSVFLCHIITGSDSVFLCHNITDSLAIRAVLRPRQKAHGTREPVEVMCVISCRADRGQITVLHKYHQQSYILSHYIFNWSTLAWPSEPTFINQLAFDGFIPIAIDVVSTHNASQKAVILWQNPLSPNVRKAVVYASSGPDTDTTQHPAAKEIAFVIPPAADKPSGSHEKYNSSIDPFVQIRFNDEERQILYSLSSSRIYSHYSASHETHRFGDGSILPSVSFNSTRLKSRELEDGTIVKGRAFRIDIPFYGTHLSTRWNPTDETNTHLNNTSGGYPTCWWRYLSIGVSKHRNRSAGEGTQSGGYGSNNMSAYLFRSLARCRWEHCGHKLNLDRGRRLDNWSMVAKLCGYTEHPDDPAGVMATTIANPDPYAPAGIAMLAIASSKKIYIWVINPTVILMGNPQGHYPPAMQFDATGELHRSQTTEGDDGAAREDNDRDSTAQWQNPNPVNQFAVVDNPQDDQIVHLEPLVLDLDAVCYSLKFPHGNSELIALTDKGVMAWNIDPCGKGARLHNIIDIDADAKSAPNKNEMDGINTDTSKKDSPKKGKGKKSWTGKFFKSSS